MFSLPNTITVLTWQILRGQMHYFVQGNAERKPTHLKKQQIKNIVYDCN